ncbi:MAG: ATP-binding protein, partial [Planctomycetota bacterium]
NLLILGRHHSLKKKEVSINDLIKNLLEPLKNKLDSQGIRVILNLDRNLSTVTADPEQLQIALINLIQNAEEAMEETSRKELTIITTVVQNNQFNITVSDTGKGIENENLPRIFDTFFSTKELGIGAGLGLSITENIINAHQGKITVESVPGQGATFSITLPR